VYMDLFYPLFLLGLLWLLQRKKFEEAGTG
jgi:hypothetical protein